MRLTLKMVPLVSLITLCLGLLGAGCDGAAFNEVGTQSSDASDAPPSNAPDTSPPVVVIPDRGDAYTPGVAKEGAYGLQVRLMESDPAPKYIGKYTWELELAVTYSGETVPVSGIDLIATPTMPAHGHGTFPPTTAGARNLTTGGWTLVAMDLFMPGLWQIDLRVEWEDPFGRFEGLLTSEVTFEFALDG